jgi:predicted ArsR family transcriptional regulator
VLEFIAICVRDRGVSPTMLEIGSFLGAHKTTAREHVYKLVDRGALGSRNWGMPRSLFLTEAAQGLIGARSA